MEEVPLYSLQCPQCHTVGTLAIFAHIHARVTSKNAVIKIQDHSIDLKPEKWEKQIEFTSKSGECDLLCENCGENFGAVIEKLLQSEDPNAELHKIYGSGGALTRVKKLFRKKAAPAGTPGEDSMHPVLKVTGWIVAAIVIILEILERLAKPG